MQTLVTGVSGYVGAALVARLQRDGHAVRGFARSRERVAAAGAVPDALVLGDVVTGAGLDEALEDVEVAYYLIHSMEGAAAGAFADTERRSAETFAAARGGGGRAARGLPRRAGARRRAALAPPRLPPRGGARPAGGGARDDRAARLDRHRRPVALVPLPRPADRADAGAGAAGLARQPHRADRRPRRARVPGPRGHGARRGRRPVVGHRRAGRDDLRGDDRPDRRRDDGPPAEPAARRDAHAGRLRRGRGDRGRGPRADRPADGVARARPAPARGHDAATAFGVHLHAFDAAVERALRDWERTEELAGR